VNVYYSSPFITVVDSKKEWEGRPSISGTYMDVCGLGLSKVTSVNEV